MDKLLEKLIDKKMARAEGKPFSYSIEHTGNKKIKVIDRRPPRPTYRAIKAVKTKTITFLKYLIDYEFSGEIIFDFDKCSKTMITLNSNDGKFKVKNKTVAGIKRLLSDYVESVSDYKFSIVSDGDRIKDILEDKKHEIKIVRLRLPYDRNIGYARQCIKDIYQKCLDIKKPVTIIINDDDTIVTIKDVMAKSIDTKILNKTLQGVLDVPIK